MFESCKMAAPLNVLILLSLFIAVFSKNLHEKKTLEAKDKETKAFMTILNNQDFFKNIRYVRHVKAVTESVLDHLIGEIKQQYLNGKYNANSPIPRLIRNLNKELKRNERRKLINEKAKKKNANKKKANKKNPNKKKTTVKKKKPMTTIMTTERPIGIIA